jgi:cytochrome c peroxidase
MMRKAAFILFFLSVLYSFKETDFSLSMPVYFGKPVYDFNRNMPDSAKIELGRMLFYDPLLSRNGMISCASCHSPYNAFSHTDHSLSHGVDDRIGKRNAPALMNLAWSRFFMWDGAVHHLDMVALAPIQHPDEMDETLQNIIHKLSKSQRYTEKFKTAYGDSSITGERLLKSFSQFLVSIVSAESKYDSVMRHEKVFTEQEANGYRLFKKYCNSCHTEPLFTNNEFANNGLLPDAKLNDAGRMRITLSGSDSLKFKIPTLRNIEFTFPYMHDGRFQTLSAVLKHYADPAKNSMADKRLTALALNSKEKTDLIAFLLTLSDRQFLFNEKYAYPKTLLIPDKQINQ